MSYHVMLRPRADGVSISLPQLQNAVWEVSGVMSEADKDGSLIEVPPIAGSGTFFIFLTDGSWWTDRLLEPEFGLFLRIADQLSCDLEGDEGEVYRMVDGNSTIVVEPRSKERRSTWTYYNWCPLVALSALLLMVAMFSYFLSG